MGERKVSRMAITKMNHLKGGEGSNGLKRSIVYIMNPEKTEGGLLVGGNAGTTPEEVFQSMMETKDLFGKRTGRQGYHFVISWKPGDITKETAYKAAEAFCEKYLGDDYDYVYAIHTDQLHIHAHIIFNSVNRRTGYKYRYEKGDWEKFIQPVTDEVCRENGLPVLSDQRTGEGSMKYSEHKAKKEGMPTLTKIVRADIDRMILRSDSFEDFLNNMRRLGYRIREGKYITYYPPGIERGRRDRTLGEGYSREEITYRILHKEKEGEPSIVIHPSHVEHFDVDIGPYLSRKLSPMQFIYVVRVRQASRYLDAKNPFAVRWRKVRKDAMEIGRMFEECMYLLDHDIHDLSALQEREKSAGRKEKNLIKRIRNRNQEEESSGFLLTKEKEEVIDNWNKVIKKQGQRS